MTHDALLVFLPIFISIRAIPPAGVVMPLVGETYSNSVVPKGPKLLDQPIVKLVVPLPFEKSDDCFSPIHELSSITPEAVDCICEGNLLRIARIPPIFRFADLGDCGLQRKWWD